MKVTAKQLREALEKRVTEERGRAVGDHDFIGRTAILGTTELCASGGRSFALGDHVLLSQLLSFLVECEEDEDIVARVIGNPNFHISLETDKAKAGRERHEERLRLQRYCETLSGREARNLIDRAGLFWVRRSPIDMRVLAEYVLQNATLTRIDLSGFSPVDGERHHRFWEGGQTHRRLCAIVAAWFESRGWGWYAGAGGVCSYAGGICDVTTKQREPVLYVECGNLSSEDKLLRGLQANESLLYVPFPSHPEKIHAMLFEPKAH